YTSRSKILFFKISFQEPFFLVYHYISRTISLFSALVVDCQLYCITEFKYKALRLISLVINYY
ncbi:MAG: hypothetical protein ACI8RD_001994, partial [Bacillariaceae sp.]